MRKLASVVLALILAIAVMPVFSTQVYAADYRIEKAIEWAIATANDDTHGYSMSDRHGPNYDCSSFVSYAFKNAGFDVKITNSSSMISVFSKAGFKAYKKSEVTPRRGDIYVQPGSHVELYIGDNTCVGAHENTDGKSGDSKGNEIDIRHTSKCSWCRNKQYTYILRYEGPETYTYTFAYNTLKGESNVNSFTADMNKSFTVNYTATKDGYTLKGWNVQRCRDNKWFSVKGGWLTEEQIYQSEDQKAVYENGTSVTFNSDWTSSYSCDTQYIFYAVWTPNEYTVSFDANGGSNTPDAQTKLHDHDMFIPSTLPMRTGYAFLGWAETPTATVPTYLPGARFYGNQSATLYAVWGTAMTGDLYCDGKVDTSDFALFKIILVDSPNIVSNDMVAADCNGDGYVNTGDLAAMKLYLAGYEQ